MTLVLKLVDIRFKSQYPLFVTTNNSSIKIQTNFKRYCGSGGGRVFFMLVQTDNLCSIYVKEGNVLFNDNLSTFYLVSDHSVKEETYLLYASSHIPWSLLHHLWSTGWNENYSIYN